MSKNYVYEKNSKTHRMFTCLCGKRVIYRKRYMKLKSLETNAFGNIVLASVF